MLEYDIILLTESRYENPKQENAYTDNVLLEDKILTDSFLKRGLKVGRFDWNRNDIDWSQARFLLFRSTWDYHEKWDEFSKWIVNTQKKTQFINPIDIIKWNFDKRYLLELADKGVNIAKTELFEIGQKPSLKSIFQAFAKEEIVIKPLISAAGRHTYRINKETLEDHEDLFIKLLEKEAMMVQEFQHNILSSGEVSLMFFGGRYTHSILKIAKKGEFRVQDDFGGSVHDYEASKEEIAFAKHVIEQVNPVPAYARVDIFKDNAGDIALAELELIEPELWFRNHPEAADVLADVISTYK
jgi:glutathione synthase/RimK-type ligase-like ATP-grasp enzyme